MKKIFLDILPKNNKRIDWKNSIGYKVRFIYDDIEGEVEIIDYNTEKRRLNILYNNIEFSIITSSFLECNLGRLLDKYSSIFKYNIGDIIKTNTGNIKILEQIRISRNNKFIKGYKYECLTDGNIDQLDEYSLNYGVGCNVCHGKKVLKGYNDIWTTHPKIAKLLKYSENGYNLSYGSNKSEIFICPDCNWEKEHLVYMIIDKGFSCPKCGDGFSYPNKLAFNLLEQLNLDFIPEYNPDWIKPKKYDFYFELNDKDYIIEMDGKLGHGNNNTLSKLTAKETQEIDDYKDKLAREHNINIIRIDCLKSDLEYIKNNILSSQLNDLFDLSNIDWNKCEEYALNSLVKIACDYWNNGIKSTKEIAKLMKLSRKTIIKYLKQGAELGWCDYDSKEEMLKGRINSEGKFKIKIAQLSMDGNFIREWDSAISIEKELNICHSSIAACCRGKYKHSNNFRWMYLNDYINNKNNIKSLDNYYKGNLPIVQLDKDDILIKIWDNMNDAGKTLNINLSALCNCCRGKTKSSGGFNWMYYDKYIEYIELIQ